MGRGSVVVHVLVPLLIQSSLGFVVGAHFRLHVRDEVLQVLKVGLAG